MVTSAAPVKSPQHLLPANGAKQQGNVTQVKFVSSWDEEATSATGRRFGLVAKAQEALCVSNYRKPVTHTQLMYNSSERDIHVFSTVMQRIEAMTDDIKNGLSALQL